MPANRSSLTLILPIITLLMAGTSISGTALAAEYLLNPGDQLHISVWGEDNLQQDVLILPDGTLSFPLVGTLHAAGKDLASLRMTIARKLKPFVPDATVTVTVTATSGNLVYIIGKVNQPGTYTLIRPTDVMQALSLAGGLARFAKEDEIRILRRQGKAQRSIPFDYSRVIAGQDLTTNILLESGDTIVVP